MTLIDRIKEYRKNNPDYNPRDFLSDELDIRQFRKDLMKPDYTLKELAIDSTVVAGVTSIITTYLMHKEQIELLVDYYFK